MSPSDLAAPALTQSIVTKWVTARTGIARAAPEPERNPAYVALLRCALSAPRFQGGKVTFDSARRAADGAL